MIAWSLEQILYLTWLEYFSVQWILNVFGVNITKKKKFEYFESITEIVIFSCFFMKNYCTFVKCVGKLYQRKNIYSCVFFTNEYKVWGEKNKKYQNANRWICEGRLEVGTNVALLQIGNYRGKIMIKKTTIVEV